MPLDRTRPDASGKSARLKKWGDENDDSNNGDDIFGGEFGDEFGGTGDFLAQLNESNGEILSPVDEFETLKLAPAARGISSSATDSKTGELGKASSELKQGFIPGAFDRFVEKGDDDGDLSFGEDLPADALKSRMNLFKQNEYRHLPGAISLLSPARRRSLSDFSESTDTDITEINDEDFDEIDDIFGKEESGIYSSGGTRASKKRVPPGRAQEVLSQRKQKLAEQARAEDDEYFKRYINSRQGRRGGDFADPTAEEINTLKLKDLRLYDQLAIKRRLDPWENEATINYEYTKDDFESFEDGFVGDLPSIIRQDKLSHFSTRALGTNDPLLRKASMPVFPRSLKTSKPTKFKSTMDLASAFGEKASEHPLFNKNNKIIRKLDRMPSFHIKNGHQNQPPLNEDLLDYNMELHKKQLLEKYMEISEKQFQLRSSPRKKSSNRHPEKPTKKGVGIVRYLNNRLSVPFVTDNKQMKFNDDSKIWEGNDHDLLRFEDNKDDGSASKKQKLPSLITLEQFKHQKDSVKGNMVYDAENLRWVNKNALEEEQEDVFGDLPDLTPNDIPQYAPKTIQSRPMAMDRGVSAFTQRTVLTASNGSTVVSTGSAGEEFTLSSKLMAKFEKEETKIRKKTHHWFGPNETYHLNKRSEFDAEYFWEIRKMVMDK